MAYDTSNTFARILRGEVPAFRVYEDEHTLAFMDVMPQSTTTPTELECYLSKGGSRGHETKGARKCKPKY